MIPTAIGLGSGSAMHVAVRRMLQAQMAEVGLQPYFPQLAYERSYNLWKQAGAGTGRLAWKERTWEAVRTFPEPLLFSYNRYYYAQQPGALRLGGVAQDDLTWQGMSERMAQVMDGLQEQGVRAPWVLVDEPPHERSARWTYAQDVRIQKFFLAAHFAGWTVGIACPSGSHLTYWAKRLGGGVRWILNAKNPITDYRAGLRMAKGSGGRDIWLYNARTFDGLAEQMKAFKARGYLHWSVEWKENPLATVGLTAFALRPAWDELLAQLSMAL